MTRVARRGGSAVPRRLASMALPRGLMGRFGGAMVAATGLAVAVALATYHAADPSFDASSGAVAANLLGAVGAGAADLMIQMLGLAAWAGAAILVGLGISRLVES